jgi:hypothetical protein
MEVEPRQESDCRRVVGVLFHPARSVSQFQKPAGVPFADLVLHFHIAHGGPKSHRRYQFSESTSFNARLSSLRSATTCFSFRFLILQLFQPFRLAAIHATVLGLPAGVSLFADPELTRFGFLDLLLYFHVSVELLQFLAPANIEVPDEQHRVHHEVVSK